MSENKLTIKERGFSLFNPCNHTSDEIEFRVRCKSCGVTDMDIENSCLNCDCEWFQDRYSNNSEFDDDNLNTIEPKTP